MLSLLSKLPSIATTRHACLQSTASQQKRRCSTASCPRAVHPPSWRSAGSWQHGLPLRGKPASTAGQGPDRSRLLDRQCVLGRGCCNPTVPVRSPGALSQVRAWAAVWVAPHQPLWWPPCDPDIYRAGASGWCLRQDRPR